MTVISAKTMRSIRSSLVYNRRVNDQEKALAAARGGDGEAFKSLADPYRNELLTHCYRMLGSAEDAEDQLQETYLRAWRRLETYEGRASFRAWLYRIATNACLDALEHRPKRILPFDQSADKPLFDPSALEAEEPAWIQPFPDQWLAPASPNPEAQYDAHESISLAFMVALQVLPPRQRAVLILSDVLGWSTPEISDNLGITASSVTSLLHRARATMKQRNFPRSRESIRAGTPDPQTKELLKRYLHAWETADIEGIIALLTQDATFPMPPALLWTQGKGAIRAIINETILAGDARERWKLVAIQANGQPGFAFYRLDEASRVYLPFALQLITIEKSLVSGAITFGFPSLFRYFDLPANLTG